MENMEKVFEKEESSIANNETPFNPVELSRSIERSRDYLLSRQHEQGYWVDELEANVTISAELISTSVSAIT